MKRSGRGRSSRERVDAARRQAALALGRDPEQRDSFIEPAKASAAAASETRASDMSPVSSQAIGVLSIGEAAARLGMSRSQLGELIDRGVVKALPTGFTRMIATSEVDRLMAQK